MPINVATNDLMRIVLFGRFNSAVETRNVFYYKVQAAATPAAAEDNLAGYARGLWEHLKFTLRAVTSQQMRYYQVECGAFDENTALVVNAETYVIPGAEQAGTVVDESLPPANTWTFRYIRSDINFRHGYKRFAGVPEQLQAAGIITGSGSLVVNALAAQLAADVAPVEPTTGVAGVGSAQVCITRQEQNGAPVLPVLVNFPSSVVYSAIGTQNSRKLGRGV